MHPENYDEKNYLTYEGVCGHIKQLQGEVLTLLESCLSDQKQRKAAKDIANSYFNRRLESVFKITHHDLEHGDTEFFKKLD